MRQGTSPSGRRTRSRMDTAGSSRCSSRASHLARRKGWDFRSRGLRSIPRPRAAARFRPSPAFRAHPARMGPGARSHSLRRGSSGSRVRSSRLPFWTLSPGPPASVPIRALPKRSAVGASASRSFCKRGRIGTRPSYRDGRRSSATPRPITLRASASAVRGGKTRTVIVERVVFSRCSREGTAPAAPRPRFPDRTS